MKAVILAGGSGERFWPYSTPDKPKQFLRLFNDRSLLGNTYDRLRERFLPSDIVIVTSRKFSDITKNEIPELPDANILGENVGRNTAAACMVGTMTAKDNEPVLVVPSDHYIRDVDQFWKSFDRALDCLRSYDGLYTFGIVPNRDETGYGYIEMGDEVLPGIHKARSFIEKPDQELARSFIAKGRYLWNSGIFIWNKSTFLNEMRRCMPSVYNPLKDVDPRDPGSLSHAYESVESISVDHALLERSAKVYVVRGEFSWSDLGSWLSLMELEGPTQESPYIALPGSSNVFIKSKSGKRIAVVGLSDVIVVESEEGILVSSSKHTQNVREAASHFKRTT